MKKPSHLLRVGVVALGLAAGFFLVGSLGAGDGILGARTMEIEDSDPSARPALLPPTNGHEERKFSSRISSISNGDLAVSKSASAVVHLRQGSSLPDEVCYEIQMDVLKGEGCIPPDVLETGLAYMAYQEGGGSIIVVGVVPDEISSVEIDGSVIGVIDNIWQYTGKPGQYLGFTVRSEDGSSASVGV